MQLETYKAENSDELIWLRLNRLKSTRLCENLIRAKLEKAPNPAITEDIIKDKAIGVSSAIESAIGYWQGQQLSFNARILSRYYFMLQMTIAEQVCSVENTYGLKEIQKHTERGHGLAMVTDPKGEFPGNLYVCALTGGHFYAYAKSVGVDMKSITVAKKPSAYAEAEEPEKLVSIADLFLRIPELSRVIGEYIDQPPLAFHIGYSDTNNIRKGKAVKDYLDLTGKFELNPPVTNAETLTDISFYTYSDKVTPAYLETLKTPLVNFRDYKNPIFEKPYIIGELNHANGTNWGQFLGPYRSSYATTSYVIPLWTKHYDSVLTNFTLLYALSIIVRYLPDLWYRINSGDLNHMGSLIEYYISIMDHVVPLQMLEQITGTSIEIHSPGSMFGQI